MVRHFPYVFLEDLLNIPIVRSVEFFVNLLLRTTRISKAPYRMGRVEQQELGK